MQIPLVALVLGALIPVSGLIAWAGDRIGHQVGKRRHTLLGLRPRHTAMLFTIGSGVGISLVSFTLLWISSAEFRTILSEGVGLLTLNKSLRAQNNTLELEVRRRAEQTESARTAAAQALADRNAAEAVRDKAFEASEAAKDELGSAQAAVTQARQAYQLAESRLGTTEGRLHGAMTGLKTAQDRLQTAQVRLSAAETEKTNADRITAVAQVAAREAQKRQAAVEKSAASTLLQTEALLKEQSGELAAQKVAFAQEADKQRADLAKLQTEVGALEVKRDKLTVLTTALRGGQITYRIGEEVDRMTISSDQSIWKIEGALQSCLRDASKKAATRGATGGVDPSQPAIALAPPLAPETSSNSENGTASNAILPAKDDEDDTVRALAQTIRKSDDDVAVVLTAAANAVVGEPVLVDIKTYRDPVVLQSGVKLGEMTLTGGQTMTRQDAADTVYDFLRRDIRQSLLTAGVIPIASGDADDGGSSVVSLTGSEWLKIMDDVKRANFRARIVVKTAKALRAADTVALEFEVKALPPPVGNYPAINPTGPGDITP